MIMKTSRRRCFQSFGLFMLGMGCPINIYAKPLDVWNIFKSKHLCDDGRIVDTDNNNITHSEGQGIAMLAAVYWNDLETFDRLWNWTDQHLFCRQTNLFAWKYVPEHGGIVADFNNATDGDILIAWALVKAGKKWNNDKFIQIGAQIAISIRTLLGIPIANKRFLIPGREGFKRENGWTINPSYYVFPALQELMIYDPHLDWIEIWQHGIWLCEQACFGENHLPADWIRICTDGRIEIDDFRPARFSWDAIRIPLYIAWANISQSACLDATLSYFKNCGNVPAWLDLNTGERAPYSGGAGFENIRILTKNFMARKFFLNHLFKPEMDGYYTGALTLLCFMARDDLINQGVLQA